MPSVQPNMCFLMKPSVIRHKFIVHNEQVTRYEYFKIEEQLYRGGVSNEARFIIRTTSSRKDDSRASIRKDDGIKALPQSHDDRVVGTFIRIQ